MLNNHQSNQAPMLDSINMELHYDDSGNPFVHSLNDIWIPHPGFALVCMYLIRSIVPGLPDLHLCFQHHPTPQTLCQPANSAAQGQAACLATEQWPNVLRESTDLHRGQ